MICPHCKKETNLTDTTVAKNRMARIYYSMRSRCNSPKHRAYKWYGARGIKCLWNSYYEFHEDMHSSYKKHKKKNGEKNTTLERVDNNGNYCKENCRWATWEEQANNKSDTVFIIIRNKKMTIKEVSKKFNLKESTIKARKRAGYSDIEIVKIPQGKQMVVGKAHYVALKEYKEKFIKHIGRFNRKERYVIKNRLGINKENQPRTLQSIASGLKLTRQRIGQIEEIVLKQIKLL